MTPVPQGRLATKGERVAVARDVTLTTVVLLVFMVALLGPATRLKPTVFGIHLSRDAVLLLLLAVAGALGSMVHVFGSLLLRLRRGDLNERYLIWYRLRPMAGIPIAVVVFLAVRAGIVTSTPKKLDTSDVLTASAIGSLAGMCFEQVSAKLKQVFEAIFTAPDSANDATPRDTDNDPSAATGGGGGDTADVVGDETELAADVPAPESRTTPDPPGE